MSAKQKEVRWPEAEDDAEPDVTVRLELRQVIASEYLHCIIYWLSYLQACLGKKAKAGERNIVELTAEDENGEEVSHSILSLTVGVTEQVCAYMS